MIIGRECSKGQVEASVFGQLNVAANQSAVALPVAGVTGGVTSWPNQFAGDMIGFSWSLSAAGTTGSFTIIPTVNGTAISTAYQSTVGTATKGRVNIPRGAVRTLATDVIGVKITTAAGWDGTTSDLAVVVRVLSELEGV